MMKIVHLQFVIPGRRAAASPESIFQRPVFMDSGPSPAGYPGMTSLANGSQSSTGIITRKVASIAPLDKARCEGRRFTIEMTNAGEGPMRLKDKVAIITGAG